MPVFAEHETVARDGRRLKFTRHELQAVCDRCNRRIRETGDYAAVTLGHTPEPGEGVQQPEMIGVAGPFRLGMIGEPGTRQRYAILADFHVYRDDLAKFRKHPRRSPELWLEDRFEDMFLDPIALLGAEAPRLDMGMLLYTAQKNGRLVERYAAACPAAANVSIPTHGGGKPRKYEATPQEKTPMALSPDDVQQIVDALMQLDWVQYTLQKMQEDQGANATAGAPQEPPPDAAAPPPPPGPEAAPPPPPGPAEPPAGPPPPMEAGPPGAEPPGPPKAPDADEEKEKMAAGGFKYPPKAGAMGKRRYEADDVGTTGKTTDGGKIPPGGMTVSKTDKKDYAAGVAAGDVDPEKTAPSDNGSNDPSGGGDAASTYEKGQVPAKFSKRLADLEAQLGAEKLRRVNAERYARLSGMRQVLAFDLDETVSECTAEEMDEKNFEKYCRVLETHTVRIPVFATLPSASPGASAVTSGNPSDRGFSQEKYSKSQRLQALDYCKARAMTGKEYISYEEAVARISRGEALPE